MTKNLKSSAKANSSLDAESQTSRSTMFDDAPEYMAAPMPSDTSTIEGVRLPDIGWRKY